MRLAIFHPAARTAIRLFPKSVRRELGKAIFDLQNGATLGMPISKVMPSIAAGVSELRIRDRNGVYRIFYYCQSTQGVLIFHAFMKKTRAIPKRELDIAKRRLKELVDEKV